jgi:hypothetical protein
MTRRRYVCSSPGIHGYEGSRSIKRVLEICGGVRLSGMRAMKEGYKAALLIV